MEKNKMRYKYPAEPRQTGVYGICYDSRIIYVGGSKRCMYNRMSVHDYCLKRGIHPSERIQVLWEQTKGKKFSYIILEYCAPELVLEREKQWTSQIGELLSTHPAGAYNLSPETKEKMKISAIRVGAEPVERKRRSRRAKQQHKDGKLGRQTWKK